jgi:hypothetical protein
MAPAFKEVTLEELEALAVEPAKKKSKALTVLDKAPPAYPGQDKRLGLIREQVGARTITKYDPGLALQICELISEGFTLSEICADREHFPHKATFNRWCVNNPDLRKAYLGAREISAFALEDQALNMAREIVEDPGSSQRVRAFDIAMNQLRWSAAKRNPREYGEKSQTNVVVPIQINTGLDLGQGGAQAGTPGDENIYTVSAKVEVPVVEIIEPQPDDKGLVPRRPVGHPKGPTKPRPKGG